LVLLFGAMLLMAPPAFAKRHGRHHGRRHNAAITANTVLQSSFELLGTQRGQPYDWVDLFDGNGAPLSLPDGFITSEFSRDYASPDASTFTTGSKDILDINPGWQCAPKANVNSKINI